MTAEITILKAEVVVHNAETKFLKDLIGQVGGEDTVLRPEGSEEVIGKFLKEKKRLDPCGKWDEEEVIIAGLERKKKKR